MGIMSSSSVQALNQDKCISLTKESITASCYSISIRDTDLHVSLWMDLLLQEVGPCLSYPGLIVAADSHLLCFESLRVDHAQGRV